LKGQVVMSHKELDRVKIMNELIKGKLSKYEAQELLAISIRQLYRLLAIYQAEGDTGMIHGLRGKKSNSGYSKEVKNKVISLYRSQYNDYGPTLFSEKLIEYHNLNINRETIRLWLRSEAVCTGMRKKRAHRKRRERRTGFGDLLQFDGSPHDWFEGLSEECCLLHAVDDATSRVYLRFARSENTHDAMLTMWEYVMRYGVPRHLYTDRGSVFYAEKQMTDFTRAMQELGCQIIFARSPQAKGRVERGNKTFQDRLIKAMREKGISGIAEGNKFLRDTYLEVHNNKFSVAAEAPDVHYSILDKDLKNIFCYKTEWQVRNDYTITLDGIYIQLLKGETPLLVPRQMVQVHKWLDDSLHIYSRGNELSCVTLKTKPKAKALRLVRPGSDHPWRGMNNKLKVGKRA